jgi:hypothetical protein
MHARTSISSIKDRLILLKQARDIKMKKRDHSAGCINLPNKTDPMSRSKREDEINWSSQPFPISFSIATAAIKRCDTTFNL